MAGMSELFRLSESPDRCAVVRSIDDLTKSLFFFLEGPLLLDPQSPHPLFPNGSAARKSLKMIAILSTHFWGERGILRRRVAAQGR